MRYARLGAFHQLRLERGEDIPATVVDFIKRQKIKSGIVTGLGAAEKVILGYFDRKYLTYRKRRFPGEYEIASIVGNIAWDGKNPVCHLHAVIADSRMTTHGGHLFAGKVTATCEITILPGQKKLKRATDPATGLKLLQLPTKSRKPI